MDEFLKVFTEGGFDQSYIEAIYSINQDNVPEVGSLNSLDQQQKLLSISSYHSILLKDNELIGFAICFRESRPYWSENYKHFENKLDRFLYVDRIAIRSEYRRQGHAKRMYEDIFNFANRDNLTVTAEVNTKPANEGSIIFHEYMGFKEVGGRSFDDHDVGYFISEPSKNRP